MNVGQAIQPCRMQRNAFQTASTQEVNRSVSYVGMLEKSDRDQTVPALTRNASALSSPIGVLFPLAAETEDVGAVDQKLSGALARSALTSPRKCSGTTNVGENHG